MLDPWLQIGGGALLLLVLGTLLKCVSDIGQIKGTLTVVATRVDSMDSAMNARFLKIETEMNARFLRIESEMNARFVRIENLLMGRPPGGDAPPTDG